MKNIHLVFTLMFAATIAVNSSAQVEVRVTKTNKLTEYINGSLEQNISGTDTFYTFIFRDTRYKTFVKNEVKVLKRTAVIDLVNGMVELTKDDYKPKEATVKLEGLLLMKSEMFGSPYIALIADSGAMSSVTPKQARKMKAAVYAALSLPTSD